METVPLLCEQGDSIHHRHTDIRNYKIRAELFYQCQSLIPCLCCFCHLKIRIRFLDFLTRFVSRSSSSSATMTVYVIRFLCPCLFLQISTDLLTPCPSAIVPISGISISENNVSFTEYFPSEIYIYSSQPIYFQFGKSRILNGFHNVGSNSFFGFLCKARAGISYFNLPASVCDHTGDRNIPWRCTVRAITNGIFHNRLDDQFWNWLGKKSFIHINGVVSGWTGNAPSYSTGISAHNPAHPLK